MSSPLPAATPEQCTNCGAGPVGRFCAACGQRRIAPHDFTALTFLQDTLTEFISVDGRFWRTLWTLVRRPGQLARDYFDGRGTRYMRPLSLFVLLNLVFFVVQPHTGLLQWHLKGYLRSFANAQALVDHTRMERARAREDERRARGAAPYPLRLESMELFETEFEDTIQNLKKSMLFFAIPLFALALAACYGTRGRLAEHLVFSTHFYAYALFTLTVLEPMAFMSLVGWLHLLHVPARVYGMASGEAGLSAMLFAVLGTHLFVALRRMYGDSAGAALIRTIVLFVAFDGLVFLFANLMFRVTLWMM